MGAPGIAARFRATAARFPDNAFLHIRPGTAEAYGIVAGEITYGQAGAAIDVLERRYRDAGYGPGHRIGLMLDNRPAFFLHWFAINAAGAGVVPLNAELRPAELDYLLGHSGLVLAVAAAPHDASLRAAASRIGGIAVVTDDAPLPPAPTPSSTPDADPECALLYTSGTTGRPKGCVLTNAYFARAGDWYVAAGDLCAIRPGRERLITPLPMVHMNAMGFSTLAMAFSGGCVVPLDRFHPGRWWDDVRGSGATILHYLGVMPSILMKAPPDPADRRNAVRFGFGAGVDRRLHAPFEERFGFPLLEAWSMTETGAAGITIAKAAPRHVGETCIGPPDPGMALRLVDEHDVDVPAGTPGEMLVRSRGDDPRAGYFREYLKDPDATASAWAGGWFHTGDVVRQGPDGQLFFVDRRKNVIRRSGENIAAVEVESVLRRHPLVRDVAVAPVPDELRGEEVLACVVAHAMPENPAGAARDLLEHALRDLAYFKVPGYVAFVPALPLTATQKVQRGELKALAATLPGDPACTDLRPLKRRHAA